MREVLHGVGFMLHVPGLMALLTVPVALAAGEPWGLPGLLATAAIALGSGQALVWSTRGATHFQRYHSMQIAGVSWVLISLLGALPFVASAHAVADAEALGMAAFLSPTKALFESVSGFTSTGLTVVEYASALPAHLQWWRSFTEWVGGIGVILLLLAVLPAERGALHLYFSEAREEKILPTVKSTVRAIWAIYLGYTVFAVGLLWLAGEPTWRALNHGMTAIATGGFSITDDSMISAPARVQLAYIPVMLAGAVSFLVHYRLLVERRRLAALRHSAELRLLGWIVIGGAGLLILERWLFDGAEGGVATVFLWVSAITTAGFTSADLSLWADAPLLLLLTAVLVGGMAGSTSGGVKLLRVSLLLTDLRAQLLRLRASPHEVVRIGYDRRRLSLDEVAGLARASAQLVGTFMLLWLLGVFVLLHLLPAETRLAHVFFDTASALFNSGLSTGVAGADLSGPAATVLSALMLLGRLEIFPLLVLAAWAAGRR
ncbi:TrkH family potassium uptake protein [Spiribacter halobius]|uniref:Potassium transporter n=1 Tax=Sediminicurvatus halobius TaxID=2182432 RepID=A0A2U2N7P0_9GAMM|nr:TrkH family potassium uptake protein [Spiribacter halobius]PWG65098.1 potassium transporter [Spiribacter halobius]UEX78954.1 TrkH family potassium uptake protein [Spiribacter halobius]